MSRPQWFVEIVQHFFPDRYKIARWTKKSKLIRAIVDYFLFKGDLIYYLPKDKVAAEILKPLDGDARNDSWETVPFFEANNAFPSIVGSAVLAEEDVLVKIQEPIDSGISISLPSTIIKEFIDEAGYIWLMDKCLCRDTMQCKDYPIDIGCIFMGEAVLGINPGLGHLASREEARARIDLAQEYGLVHLIGKNKIDTQWMGVHPGDRLLTVCSCCPCCCLYKVLPDLDESISKKIEKMPGLEVSLDQQKCIGCGQCAEDTVCMTHNIVMEGGLAVMGEVCVGCGRCYEVCPSGAIEINITNDNFIRKTIDRVKNKVNVH